MARYTTLEQFIRFATDSYGLERILRMVQASLQVLTFSPLSLAVLMGILSLAGQSSSPLESATVLPILLGLRSKVALARRFFRMFRFLDAFHTASDLYLSNQRLSSNGKKPVEVWLDITGQSFNGMYLLLETLTLLDAMDVTGLTVWGAARERTINVEAQRFWFLSLVSGIGGALVKIVKIMAYKPVPETGEGFGDGSGEKSTARIDTENVTTNEKQAPLVAEGVEANKWEWKEERDRLRRVVTQRREQRKQWRKEVKTRSRGILRRLLADMLDLALPGAVVGWIPASPGTVGILMLGSTFLTGQSVWERCGRELAAAKSS